jgi:hypothetical protein
MQKLFVPNNLLTCLKILDALGCFIVALPFIINAITSSLLYYGNARNKIMLIAVLINGLLYLGELILLFMPSCTVLRIVGTIVSILTIALTVWIIITYPHPLIILIIGLLSSLLFILIKNQILIAK